MILSDYICSRARIKILPETLKATLSSLVPEPKRLNQIIPSLVNHNHLQKTDDGYYFSSKNFISFEFDETKTMSIMLKDYLSKNIGEKFTHNMLTYIFPDYNPHSLRTLLDIWARKGFIKKLKQKSRTSTYEVLKNISVLELKNIKPIPKKRKAKAQRKPRVKKEPQPMTERGQSALASVMELEAENIKYRRALQEIFNILEKEDLLPEEKESEEA